MKSIFVAAALAVAAHAGHVHHRHAAAHELFEKRGSAEVCTTIVETIYGAMTWKPTPAPPKPTTSSTTAAIPTTPSLKPTLSLNATSTTTKTRALTTTVTTTAVATVPTLVVETCPTPGTYTFPATTVVVTETTTVCGATTTAVPAGTHTLGGVTTVVETETTVVCPVATTSTLPGGVVTSVLEVVTYVCPSAGTYTISPVTTVCATETVVVVPVVTSFAPGTYTRPAVVTTVTVTDVVVYCPYYIPTTAPAPAPVAATTVTTAAAAPTTTTAAAKATATASSSSKSVSLGSSGDQWAITYTPYSTSGSCKTASEVLSDLTAIKAKGFTTIRVYSTDCDTLPNVGAAAGSVGLKMIIGVFIGEVGCDNGNPDVASQIAAIKAWGQWSLVELVVVGNEAGNQGFCTPAQLKSLIVEVKEIISEAGCSVPVTTTDTVNTWQNADFSGTLCSVVDVVAANAHAYFNAQTAPSEAGSFVAGQLEIVKNICGKEGYVLESGWPSSCVANGVATCSESDQAAAIASLKEALGGSIVFFSYSNDDWKDNGSCGCEQHWGCGQLF